MARDIWIGRDLPPIRRNGEDHFLLSVDQVLYLVPNRCPHRGGPLKFGYLDDAERIVCPMHGAAIPVDALIARPGTLRLTEREAADVL
jgi:nitrite reductase (NADH) small subunit